MRGSKLIWFSNAGRKSFGFSVSTWFLCGWFESNWFQCGGSNLTWFQWRDETDLGVLWAEIIDVTPVWGVGIDFRDWNRPGSLCGGRKALVFSLGIENYVFVRGGEIGFIVVVGPITVCFSYIDRNWLGFTVGIAVYLIFLCGMKMTCFHWSTDLVFMWWSKLTWFHCRDRHWLVFGVAFENDLFLVSWSTLTWFLCQGIEIDMTLDWGSKLDFSDGM